MSAQTRIVCNPEILGGKPVVAGTRLSVELLLERLAAGRTVEELLIAYPNLTREGVQAALRFARSDSRFRQGPNANLPGLHDRE